MKTPYFVYDGDMIAARCDELAQAFAGLNVNLFYAVKANDNPEVIKIAQARQIGGCLVSKGEMVRAMKGGIKPENMLMNGVGKSDDDIRFALENGIGQLNVESIPELHKIAEIAKDLNIKANICLRINPDIVATTHSHLATGRRTDKFGILTQDIEGAYEFITTQPQLVWRGFSCHIGTQVHDVSELAAGYRYMVDLFTLWRTKATNFDRLDLGGGFGVSYTGDHYARPADYAKLVGEIAGELMQDGILIQLEPGRFVAAESGTLVTEVLYVKRSADLRFLIVDAAMNNLIRPALYGAYHPITLARPSSAPSVPATIAGPVCESGDVFATDRLLPGDIQSGDILHIEMAGAYGFGMSSNYNARGFLAEYLRTGENLRLIRKNLTSEEFDASTLL